MPGHIAPAYVATDANSLITAVTAGWFGGLHMATAASAVCLCPACLTSGSFYGTLRTGCSEVDYRSLVRFPCREKRFLRSVGTSSGS
jgi:hypothetical protein